MSKSFSWALALGTALVGCAGSSAMPPRAPASSPEPTKADAVTAAPSPESVREERAAATLDRLAASDFAGARAYFDATMTEKLSADAMGGVWKGLTGQIGRLVSHKLRGEREEQGHRVRTYDCTFERGHFGAVFAFDGEQKIAGLLLVPLEKLHDGVAEQTPSGASPSRSVLVGAKGSELPGTLTFPANAKRAPGVVLVHGSGPHDRDETIGPNKPFFDLAEGLSARGVAVLRYEKRPPAQLMTKSGLTVKEEVTDDAHAAVEALRAQPEVDPSRVFVVGHSLGATLAPRIAREDPKIAGLVLLAAAARPLGELAIEQADYLAREGGLRDAEKAELENLRAQARRTLDPALDAKAPGMFLGAPASYWVDLRGYDPVATARGLDVPLLVVQGGRDYQVTEKDFALWKEGLAGRPHAAFSVHPKANHLFIDGEGRSTAAEYAKPGHVSAAVLDAIAAFVARAR